MSYQVRFEATPNPATMKFVVNQAIAPETMEFTDARDTDTSPLAAKLFGFPWTAGVFIGPDFVAVSKQDWVDWETLAEPLAGLIREHLERGEPVVSEGRPRPQLSAMDADPNDSPAVARIKHVLNEEIRPAVAMDGGDVLFAKYEDGIVHLHMRGACAGCPSSTMTLKMGIETRLKEAVPEIIEVVST